MTAIAVAAIALTGSRPESTAADAGGETFAEAAETEGTPQDPLAAR